MRIQHNIAALNAHRQLGNNNNSVSKNLEKLSSGYRINRAGDDAAGLAISEKMRAQITGLETAQKNANDGISLVQTAEGALTEVHSMLNRMVELAEQSANGTYQDAVDRDNLQKEFDSLRSEINRISEGTNFNGINLLDGSLGGPKMSSTKGVATVEGVAGAAGTAPTVTAATKPQITGAEGIDGTAATLTVSLAGASITADGAKDGKVEVGIGDGKVKIDVTAGNNLDDTAIAGALDGKTITIKGQEFTIGAAGTNLTLTASDKKALTAGDFTGLTVGLTDASDAGASEAVGSLGNATVDAVALANGTDGTAATLKFDTAGMSITAPTDGSTGAKVTLKVGGQDVELAVTADMDDKAIAAALVGKEVIVDGKTFVGSLDANGGTAVTFTAKETGVTTGVVAAAGNFTGTAAAGTIGGTTAVAGSATVKTMDFDGRTGADLLGGSMKVGDTTYSFVESAADAAQGTTAIVVAKNATATEIATAVQNAVTVNGFTGTTDGSKFVLTETAGPNNNDNNPVYAGVDVPSVSFDGIGLTLQIGDTPDSFNQLTVSIGSMNTTALGIDNIDISTQSGAKGAIELIKNAINTVSSTRGDLGALQNRLEHTINNLSVTTENMTAAESRIRDVDMAEEMMNFTKNNILTQASQAMLAQANQLPQGVLQLLQ